MRRTLAAVIFAALLLTACSPSAAPAPSEPPEAPAVPAEPVKPADTVNTPPIPEPGDTVEPEDTVKPEDTPKPEYTPQPEDTPKPQDTPGGRDAAEPPLVDRPSNAGRLAVQGAFLVSESGERARLRGISTHGIAWYPQFVNRELFTELSRDWGVNVVRLAMYTGEYGGYCSGGDREELYNLILNGVQYALDADMYAVVDWHILSDGDPNTHKAEAAEFFTRLSYELKDYNNVIYEICNEPNGPTDWDSVKAYASEIIAAIRENDSRALILVGTPNWCQYIDEAATSPIEGYDNIMYTLHFYAATHGDSLRRTMAEAAEAGLPVFVSEFGICDASGGGRVDEAEADKWVAEMDKYSISYIMWSLSNKAETASVIKSGCDKTSGFTWDDLTQAGRWLLRTLSGSPAGEGSAPTPPAAETPDGPTTPEAPDGPPAEPGRAEWSVELVNSWTSGGLEYSQYTVTITNPGPVDLDTWSVSVELGEGVTITDSWNGVFTLSGGTLTVTPMEYNSAVPAGGRVGDIGFIAAKGG